MNTKIDFAKIRQDNTKYYGEWIYDPKSFVQKFFQGLYSDKTHFIFELLQNAEDTKATKVLFQLFDDCLKFHHNGRLFDEKDIKGICNFGDSTKVENLTTIGKFGIGFKSVYAYTEKPQIFSGSLSFEIEHFVLPNQMDKNYPFEKEYTTVIVLPFKTTYKKDNKTIETSPEKAVQEITKALLHLNIRTMLFLKNIKQIQYRLPEKNGKIDGGSYFRYIKKLDDNLNLVNIKNSDKFDDEQEIKNEQYLVFSREYAKNVPPIEIAFQYQDKHTDEKGKEIPAQILPMSEQNTQHCVTFATGQNTGLHFLLQGDYNTTINRESLEKDDNKNNELIQETAELLGDILPKIKEMGLLSVDFLNALPIKNIDEYDELYCPLAEKTLELLKTGEYLPTNDGEFVSPENAVLAYAQDLTELLSSEQLKQLFKSEKHWITREVTVNKQETISLYLKNQLEIKEFSRNTLKDNLDKEFLSKQSDDWLNKFYKYLSDNSNIAKQLKTIPIIRCEDGQMRAVCKPDGEALVWLPSDSGDSSFPTVKRSIYEYGENKAFFKSLDLEQPDINDEINRLLINHYQEENKPSVADNQEHIQHIIAVWDKLDNQTQQKVRQTPLLLAKDISGSPKGYQAPENVYLPTDELKTYFGAIQMKELIELIGLDEFLDSISQDVTKQEHLLKTNNIIYFLAKEDYSIDEKDWLKIGVQNYPALLPIKRSFAEYTNFLTLTPKPKKMQENEPDGFDTWEKSDVTLLGLDLFLWVLQKQNKRDLIETLWTLIIQTYKTNIDEQEIKLDIFQGFIQWKIGKGNNNTKCYHTSKLLETLQKSPCIPNHNNELSCPKDIHREDIANWFVNEFIEPNEELFALFDIKNDDDGFPTPQVKNIERVRTKARERIDNTPFIYEEEVIRIETRNRADKNDVRTKLKNEYSNHNKNLFCQMCEQEMPTLSQNSKEYLFYTSPLFREIKKDDWTNYVCLCPTCRTKYDNHIATRDDLCSQIRHEIEKESELTRNPKIEISLPCSDEKIKIRFTQNHFLQLKTVFNHLGVDEDKKK